MSAVARARWVLWCLLSLLSLPAIADELVVQLYPAIGDAHGYSIEGRVIERRDLRAPGAADSAWTNLWRNLRRLVNDERAGVRVSVTVGDRSLTAVTDREGYFRIDVDTPLAAGWHAVSARHEAAPGAVQGALLIVPDANRTGVITDLDDTLLVTQVNDRSRLLANSLLRNPLQRQAVAGAPDFLRRQLATNPQPETAPLIYLSASPRQLSPAIEAFLAHNEFPRGVLITKKVTNDSTSEPVTDQHAYKTARIEALFARLPGVRFILVGDDGEQDPEIYETVRQRHPARVLAIWIRRVNPDPQRPQFAGHRELLPAGVARPPPD